jgi:hypothetical protein
MLPFLDARLSGHDEEDMYSVALTVDSFGYLVD